MKLLHYGRQREGPEAEPEQLSLASDEMRR